LGGGDERSHRRAKDKRSCKRTGGRAGVYSGAGSSRALQTAEPRVDFGLGPQADDFDPGVLGAGEPLAIDPRAPALRTDQEKDERVTTEHGAPDALLLNAPERRARDAPPNGPADDPPEPLHEG